MKSKFKLLLWSPSGSGLDYGGPGMTAYRLFKSQKNEDLEITLVHGNRNQESLPLFKEVIYLGSTQSGIHPSLSVLDQLWFIHNGIQWLKKNASQYDAFYGLQGFHVTVIPALFSENCGLPAYVKLVQHNSDLADARGIKKFLRAAKKRRAILPQLSGVVAISKMIVNELSNYGIPEDKINYIPNGVDTDLFRPCSKSQKSALKKKLGLPDKPTLIFSGSIIRRKQPHIVLKVMERLKAFGKDCQLVLAGPEQDKLYSEEIRSLAIKLGIQDRVIWYGFTRDISSLYMASEFFILPSLKEGMPNALLEAMATGLACLATPVSGVDDIVLDGVNGYIIDNDALKIATTINILLDHNQRYERICLKARETAENEFSSRFIFDKQMALFRDCTI